MTRNQVSKSEFKAKALEYLRQVEADGTPLIVTDRGKPSVEIRRFRPIGRSPLERLRGSVTQYSDPTEPVGEGDWEALA